MAENYVGNYDESMVLPRYLLENYVQVFAADEGRAIRIYIRALKAPAGEPPRRPRLPPASATRA